MGGAHQGVGDGSQRLHLRHHPGRRVPGARAGDRAREDWLEDPEWNTPAARLPKLDRVFAEIEKWTMTKDKFEVMSILNPLNVPCGPILSMQELAEEASLHATGTVVEVDHPTRGRYLSVGNPDQALGLPVRGRAFAAARRAHDRDHARCARLQPTEKSRPPAGRAPLAAKTSRRRQPEGERSAHHRQRPTGLRKECARGPRRAGRRRGGGLLRARQGGKKTGPAQGIRPRTGDPGVSAPLLPSLPRCTSRWRRSRPISA